MAEARFFVRQGFRGIRQEDAEYIGRYVLDAMEGGASPAEALVARFKAGDERLARYFTADPDDAAEKYWRLEARTLIRSIEIVMPGEIEPSPVIILRDPEMMHEGEYLPPSESRTPRVVQHKTQQLKRELVALAKRYEQFANDTEIDRVIVEVRALAESIVVREDAPALELVAAG